MKDVPYPSLTPSHTNALQRFVFPLIHLQCTALYVFRLLLVIIIKKIGRGVIQMIPRLGTTDSVDLQLLVVPSFYQRNDLIREAETGRIDHSILPKNSLPKYFG